MDSPPGGRAMFDVVVIGAGHAGLEAALAAARLGRRVAVVVLRAEQIGRLSCNPAVGGLAKGTLVREIDALGGAMAELADASTIQFRRLNTRKGLAVQAGRAQVDIDRYPAAARRRLGQAEGVTIVEGEVTSVRVSGGAVEGVDLADGGALRCSAVVVTTGTFLGAVMHRGEEQAIGGRVGDGAAHALARCLRGLGLRTQRLKTGTTPRLDGRTIDWSKLEVQPENCPGGRFSFGPAAPRLPRRDCYLGWTDARLHELVRGALHRSPMFTGTIEGRGPRYCPSIEDKVARFAGRERHQLFLEPEGLDTERVYLNGASTSLPAEVQERMVACVPGLEHARIVQHGYAVEYDAIDPTQLGHDLAFSEVRGLYLAGQVNGTSGYEEAAAQGLVAGANAAGAPLRVGRDQGYIGVLVDDLVTRGVGGEPYRVFPSRAEHRLSLREDNADRRLAPVGRAMGLVGDASWERFSRKAEAIEALSASAPPELRRPGVEAMDVFPGEDPEVAEQVAIDCKYAGYIARERLRHAEVARMDGVPLAGLDFGEIHSLSSESRERLLRARPPTLGAAARLPGVTPAAIQSLALHLARAG